MARKSYKKKKDKAIALVRIRKLFSFARKMFSSEKILSLRYIGLARKIGRKTRTRFPSEIKRQYCRKCGAYLLPGKNCRVRVTGKTITYQCGECKTFRRIGYKNRSVKVVGK